MLYHAQKQSSRIHRHCTYQGMNLKIKEGFNTASVGMNLSLGLLIPTEEMSGDSDQKVNLAQGSDGLMEMIHPH